jgi:hypothetical protein
MLPVYFLIFAIIIAVIIVVPIFGGFGKKSKGKYQKYGSAVTMEKPLIWVELVVLALRLSKRINLLTMLLSHEVQPVRQWEKD